MLQLYYSTLDSPTSLRSNIGMVRNLWLWVWGKLQKWMVVFLCPLSIKKALEIGFQSSLL